MVRWLDLGSQEVPCEVPDFLDLGGGIVEGFCVVLDHEGLEGFEALLERGELHLGEIFLRQALLEGRVAEAAAGLLLLDTQVPKDTLGNVKVQRQGTARCDGHQVEHPPGVEVGFFEAQLLNADVGKIFVDSL